MRTELIQVDPWSPDVAALSRAADVLRAGGLVAFPTETVYGLGANALDPEAVARIFQAKGRPSNNPLIVHVPGVEAAREQVVAEWPPVAERLAAAFWPGPLTLVLPKQPRVPAVVTGGGATVAVRMPAHPVAQALLRTAGVPVAAPSANRSSRLSPTTAAHVMRGLDGRIDMVIDGGACRGGIESTVLDLTSPVPRLLRPGLLSLRELREAIGAVELGAAPIGADAAMPSPGMMTRHYSPQTPLLCVRGDAKAVVVAAAARGQMVGALRFGRPAESLPPWVRGVRMPTSPAEYAELLYGTLHEMDSLQLDLIVVEMPPEGEAWLAVRDRLARAAAAP